MSTSDALVRRGESIQSHILGIFGAVIIVYHLWFAYTFGIEYNIHLVVHIASMMAAAALISIDISAIQSDGYLEKVDNFFVLPTELLLSAIASIYVYVNYERLALTSFGIYSNVDVIVGAVLVFLTLDLARRTLGWVLTGVGIAGFIYAFLGPYLPGILGHGGIDPDKVITSISVEFSGGLYGTLVSVSATYIILFLFFAGFLEAFGALDYFVKIAKRVSSRFESGMTQIAVITSLAMGSINGSSTANAATTGAFTIPTMKKRGIDSKTAASIESLASSGGQIMPPVMGAAAFLIAEFTGTAYLDVITIALLPAVIFYITVSVAVVVITSRIPHNPLETDETKMERPSEANKESTESSSGEPLSSYATFDKKIPVVQGLIDGFYLWAPVLVLVYTLVILRFGAQLAAFYSIIAALIAMLIQSLVLGGKNRETIYNILYNISNGCQAGLRQAAPIALATAAMAFFVQMLSLTGFTLVFADSIVALAGGQLALLLFFAMIGAILFGLGMPTTAAYIVSVLLVAPALTNAGVPEVTSHLYVFYFAILSAITPPVAIVCIVTSQIAEANFIGTCKRSIIMAFPLFLLPYVFVTNPSLLYWDSGTVTTFIFVCLGNIAIVVASIDTKQRLGTRVGLLVLAGLLLLAPAIPFTFVSPLILRLTIASVIIVVIANGYNSLQRLKQSTYTK